MRSWVRYLAILDPATDGAAAVEERSAAARSAVLRRLTHKQYNNTIRDLLGDDSNLAAQFPTEDFVNGFRNQYSSQSVSPLLAEAYSVAAEKLARNAFRSGDSKGLIPCKWTSPTDAPCISKFVSQFGAKAFRRPLLATEAGRYRKLFLAGAQDGKSFLAGAQLVVEAMLQSPSFLQRAENGSDSTLRPWETASRLSYFLWNSMPDAALFRAAEAGELKTAAGLEKVARRMLTDERAHAMVNEFLEQWLRFDRLLNSVKDRRAFPVYSPELALAMTEETRHLVSDLVWNNRDFTEFYSAGYSYLSSSLASLYGMSAPAKDYDRVSLGASTDRGGILGQAVFLALTSKPSDTSPTARGLFVREQFLCQEVPQPPPGVSTNLPPLTKDKPQTNRDRLAVHLTSESCASCHSLIDPIGFGLEKFDAIGKRRDKLTLTFQSNEHDEEKSKSTKVELDLDTTGDVAGLKDAKFSSPRELGVILAKSEQCQECVVKQVFRYAMGRREAVSDRPVIKQIFREFRDSGFHFQELMIALVKLTEFPSGSEEHASGTH
ncbi:MAG: DUF1592 domain-containing protein [Bryobacteraceae bacterium]|nr:DUF1592 domain-containing protein [Bryobacteraceae bacterium]